MNEVKEKLFNKGVALFNKKEFYEAHEYWEELWLEHYLEDKKFVQALIQLTVAYYHLSTKNIKGAVSLLNKSLSKMELYAPENRGINVNKLIKTINLSLKMIEDAEKFNWDIIPKIEINQCK